MTINEYSARLDAIARQEARNRKAETTPWWVEPLIGSILAVMVWLLFVGC